MFAKTPNLTQELNVVLNPNDASAGWASTGAGVSVVTTASSSDLPLAGISSTAIKITPVSGTSDYVYYRWTMPAALKGRKLKVEWHQRPLSGYASGDLNVSVYTNTASNYAGTATRLALSTDFSSVSAIPNQTGKYTTTFDSDTSDYYELRIKRAAGTTALNVASVIVGPGIQPQGAVVGKPELYAPTIGGSTSAPSLGTAVTVANWYRDGEYMVITYSLNQTSSGSAGSGTYLWPLPTGYTVNTSLITSGLYNANGLGVVGNCSAYITSTTYQGTVHVYNASNLYLFLGNETSAQAAVGSSTYSFGASTFRVSFTARVPIAEWAGSGTVNLAQNDVMYAWNSSATTGSDTSSFGYGQSGVLIQSFSGSGATGITKRVRFPAPVPTGTTPILEFKDANGWSKASERIGTYGINSGGTTAWGYRVVPVSGSTTDFDVVFYATADANLAWSSINTWYWRLVAAQPGQAVGFGEVQPGVASGLVGANGLKGRTDGVAVTSGYVGQKVEVTWSGTSAAATTAYGDIGTQQTMDAGIWMVFFSSCISSGGSQTFGNNWDCRLVIDGTGGTTYGKDFYPGGLPVANMTGYTAAGYCVVNKTAAWTLKAQARATYGGTGTPSYYGAWTAVRIA